MSASVGNYHFSPYQYIYIDDDSINYKLAYQTLKKLLNDKMLKIESPEQLIEVMDTIIEENQKNDKPA